MCNSVYQHMQIHDDSRPTFKCELCENFYKTKRGLQLHVQSIHEKISFECDKCDKHFTNKQVLQRHLEAQHSDGEKQEMKCKVCGKSYITQI